MHRKIFIDQMKRSKKTVVYVCLLLIATAFFVSSMNLYQNSVRNLQISENAFSRPDLRLTFKQFSLHPYIQIFVPLRWHLESSNTPHTPTCYTPRRVSLFG